MADRDIGSPGPTNPKDLMAHKSNGAGVVFAGMEGRSMKNPCNCIAPVLLPTNLDSQGLVI